MERRIAAFLELWGLEKVAIGLPSEAKFLLFHKNPSKEKIEAEHLGEWLEKCIPPQEGAKKITLPAKVAECCPQLTPRSGWWMCRLASEDRIFSTLLRFCRGGSPRSPQAWRRLLHGLQTLIELDSIATAHLPAGDILTDFILSAGESSSLDDLLWNLYHHIRKLIPVDAFFFGFLNPDGRSLDLIFVLDRGRRFPRVIEPVYRGIGSRAVVEKRPLLVNRTPEEIERLQRERNVNTFGDHSRISASLLAIPVFLRDRMIGVLSAQSYSYNAYRNHHLQLLQPLVSHFAVALENARLFRDHQRQMKIFALAELLQERAWQNQDIIQVIDELVSRIVEETDHAGCAFFYHDAEAECWKVKLQVKDRPVQRNRWDEAHPEQKSSLFAEVLSQRQARIFGNVEKEEWLSQIFEFSPQSLLIVPMLIEREISGALVIAEGYHQSFSPADLQWFEHLVARVGAIFQRHQLLLELERERDRLMDILNHLEEGVQILDRNFKVMYQNKWIAENLVIHSDADKCFCRLFGLSEPCPGCPCTNEEELQLPYKFEIVSDQGRCLEVSMLEFESQQGEKQILQIIRDITRDKRLEQEKRKVEQLETAVAIAGGIAHELNQPLTGITGLTSLALEDMQRDDFGYECLQQIKEQAHRMRDLIRKFQDIAKFEKMRYPGKEIFDLRRSIE